MAEVSTCCVCAQKAQGGRALEAAVPQNLLSPCGPGPSAGRRGHLCSLQPLLRAEMRGACTSGQNQAQRGHGRHCEKVDGSQRGQEGAA